MNGHRNIFTVAYYDIYIMVLYNLHMKAYVTAADRCCRPLLQSRTDPFTPDI